MNKTNELWKNINGFDGLYQISSFGRVKSLDRIIKDYMHKNGMHRKERILSQKTSKFGYSVVCLSKNNHNYHKSVHRMVAEAFIPNPENYPIINHKDENKQNNRVENLEWCSYKYNITYNNMHIRRAIKTKKTSTEKYGKKIIIKSTGEIFDSIREMCRIKKLDRRSVVKHIHKGTDKYMLIQK